MAHYIGYIIGLITKGFCFGFGIGLGLHVIGWLW